MTMDLDKLVADVKSSLIFVNTLKNENDQLQLRITTLEQYQETLETQLALKEKQASYYKLITTKEANESNVLDKIMALQMDHKLKEEHTVLRKEHEELTSRYKEAVKCHLLELQEREGRYERERACLKEELGKVVVEVREEAGARVQELEREREELGEKVLVGEREKVEEQTKMQLEFEQKLASVQRSAISSNNTDVFKRKLAQQRMEYQRQIESLQHQLAQVQTRRGRRGGYL